MLTHLNFDALIEVVLICEKGRNDNIMVSKSDVQKAMRIKEYSSDYLTIWKYIKYLIAKDILSEEKVGRRCILTITNNGSEIIKPLKFLKQKGFFQK